VNPSTGMCRRTLPAKLGFSMRLQRCSVPDLHCCAHIMCTVHQQMACECAARSQTGNLPFHVVRMLWQRWRPWTSGTFPEMACAWYR
jgi:hypothetical protein